MEYNLRQRAEIVLLALKVAKSLKADPLIEYFEELHKERSEEKEKCDVCNEYEFVQTHGNVIYAPCKGCGQMRPMAETE